MVIKLIGAVKSSSNVRFHDSIAATLRLRQGKQSNLVPRALFKAREKRPGNEVANKGHIYIKKTEVDNKLF